jgi:non-homologous end joining protein Ku
MPPRANWKGYLRLSLVSCPIALYPASSFSRAIAQKIDDLKVHAPPRKEGGTATKV